MAGRGRPIKRLDNEGPEPLYQGAPHEGDSIGVDNATGEQFPVSFSASFGKRIKAARLRRGASQVQLAGVMHVDRDTVSAWERGNQYPDPYTLNALCVHLHVSPNYIFGWSTTFEEDAVTQFVEGAKFSTSEEHDLVTFSIPGGTESGSDKLVAAVALIHMAKKESGASWETIISCVKKGIEDDRLRDRLSR